MLSCFTHTGTYNDLVGVAHKGQVRQPHVVDWRVVLVDEEPSEYDKKIDTL